MVTVLNPRRKKVPTIMLGISFYRKSMRSYHSARLYIVGTFQRDSEQVCSLMCTWETPKRAHASPYDNFLYSLLDSRYALCEQIQKYYIYSKYTLFRSLLCAIQRLRERKVGTRSLSSPDKWSDRTNVPKIIKRFKKFKYGLLINN